MIKNVFAIAALVMMMASMGGCHGPYKAKSDEKEALEHTENVVYMSKELKDWMRIDTQSASFTDEGRLQAYCEMRNRGKKNLVVQVQTVFKDERGLGLNDMTNWETVVIPQNSIHYYKATAMSEKARNYVIRIKLAR